MDAEHPAARFAGSVATLRSRATLASIALGAVALARGWEVIAYGYSVMLLGEVPPEGADPELMARLENADALVNSGQILIPLTFVVCAVLFLRWMHRLALLARQLDASRRWLPAQAVWAWIIPFVSLARPYQIISDIHSALEPDKVEAPATRRDPDASNDYRSVAFIEPSPALKMPAALVGLWWGMFLVMSFGSRIVTMVTTKVASTPEAVTSAYHGYMFVSGVAVVAAVLAITVVRGVTARAAERYRRIRESTPEALIAQGVELEAQSQ